MKDKDLEQRRAEREPTLSPLEMIIKHGGRARKIKGMAKRGADSMIAVYKDRCTYTFIMKNEVASIHFDKGSGKIFFSGHNIANIRLTKGQKRELYNLVEILEHDEEGRELKEAFEATLSTLLADNNKGA